MTPKQKTMAWLAGGVALMVVGTAVMFVLAKSCAPALPPTLVLSKETTWFTGPVLPNGGIDWVAALEAEARAEGLKDEENGAPLLRDALVGFVSLRDFIAARSPSERSAELEWIEACEPALEKARLAAERPGYFLIWPRPRLVPFPTLVELPALDHSLQALRLRIALRTERGDVELALADAATACVLARATGSPATFEEQMHALYREIALLEQIALCVRAVPSLPADRVLAVVEARPARWTGESALKEALRCERLVATCWLDVERSTTDLSRNFTDNEGYSRAVQALARVDLNRHFRRLQGTFDDLDSSLLGSASPARDRIDSFRAQLQLLIDAGNASGLDRTGSFELAMLPDDRLLERFVDGQLVSLFNGMRESCGEWLSLTARRDALLAELAARAGAPERRDSWLGERLIVTRNKDDGSIEVGGTLIELARERGAKDEE